MRILLLNEYFPPDTSATAKMAAQVVEALAREHHVSVIAGRPSYDPEQRHAWRLLRREQQGNVTIEQVGSVAFPRHQMRRRIANYLSYLALAFPRSLFLPADVILCMTDPPPLALLAAAVAAWRNKPFIYNIRDLYPEMALEGEIVAPAMWVRVWEKLHRAALRTAARVIVLGDDMRERILAKGISPDRVVVVRDGAVPLLQTPDSPNHVSAEIRSGFSFVALHAGNLGFYGAWGTLLQAAERLAEGVGLVFVGDGANRRQLEGLMQGSSRVRFLPFRPPSELPAVMAAGDIHVITVRRGLEGVVVPSKLYSTLAAGRPVLAVAPENSDVARIVREAGCGLVASPDDPAGVARAINDLCASPQRLVEMGRRALQASARYVREDELQKFVRNVAESVSRESQGSAAAVVERKNEGSRTAWKLER